jgi:hypothetical protein
VAVVQSNTPVSPLDELLEDELLEELEEELLEELEEELLEELEEELPEDEPLLDELFLLPPQPIKVASNNVVIPNFKQFIKTPN